MKYFKQIDGFRFIATFLVLMSHWLFTYPMVNELHLGQIGVDSFFVISGFLISFQLYILREEIEAGRLKFSTGIGVFLARRSLRIFPLYYLVVILATLFNKGEIRDAFIYNITYTSNFYFIKVQQWNNIFSHFWSLSVEEHFYLVWPFIILSLNRKWIPWLATAILLGSTAFRYFTFSATLDYMLVYVHTLSCLDLFMFGALLAFLLRYHESAFMRIFSSVGLRYLVFAALIIAYILTTKDQVADRVLLRSVIGIFALYSVGAMVVGIKGPIGRFIGHKWLVKGGKLSYAIYLIHNFIPGILLPIKKLHLPLLVEFVIYLITAILISEVMYRVVETPIRKLGNRFKVKYAAAAIDKEG